jgi:DNA (cytosine-5)-methyltransferase 1
MSTLNVLSLFSGIGGLDLGLERAGMRLVGLVERDPFCRSVLATHWPEVPIHDDVRTAPGWWRAAPSPAVHLVAGGFPCQPFSCAGRRQGTADSRWGWPWFFNVVRELRPGYVLVENVADLLADRAAFGWLLGDLASIGFNAQWSLLSACAVGAPHVRSRLFLVAYPHREHGPVGLADPGQPDRWHGSTDAAGHGRPSPWPDPVNGMLAAHRPSRRMADGIPDRMEPARVRALGNAVVPQVAEHLGRLILAAEHRANAHSMGRAA